MATLWRALRKLISGTNKVPRPPSPNKRFEFSFFAEGDRVYVSGKRPKFSKPLQQGGKLETRDGFIYHDEIIGAKPGQTFRTNQGKPYRITFPDLDTYISSMPRKVTPVYGTYANFIVSLFDIHVSAPTSANKTQQPLEILDTGTGHGSVTLHLARAIQAANPPIPNVELERYASSSESPSDDSSKSTISTSEDSRAVWEEWRRSRRAIVHSVEISPIYSKHAERKVVAGFRRGLYSPHIDFHVSNVNDWVANQLRCRNHEAFLSYVFLDMPSCHRYLQKVATAMKEDGLIAVFTPSITQLGDCIREIKANALPLKMEKALELGDGISNGRLWDIRLTVKKATDPIDDLQRNSEGEGDDHKETQQEADTQNETPSMVSSEENLAIPSQKASSTDDFSIDKAVMVCRPKVGERVIGGGFVGLWRKTPSK